MGLGGHHLCSNSVQGNGFTWRDFWVVVFLKPIIFSGSFSEHSSSMTWGWNTADNCPNVYRRQKKQDLLGQQRAGAELWMQMGSRCSQQDTNGNTSERDLPLASTSSSHFLLLFFVSFGMSGPWIMNFQCIINPCFRGFTLPFCQPMAAPLVQPI